MTRASFSADSVCAPHTPAPSLRRLRAARPVFHGGLLHVQVGPPAAPGGVLASEGMLGFRLKRTAGASLSGLKPYKSSPASTAACAEVDPTHFTLEAAQACQRGSRLQYTFHLRSTVGQMPDQIGALVRRDRSLRASERANTLRQCFAF